MDSFILNKTSNSYLYIIITWFTSDLALQKVSHILSLADLTLHLILPEGGFVFRGHHPPSWLVLEIGTAHTYEVHRTPAKDRNHLGGIFMTFCIIKIRSSDDP